MLQEETLGNLAAKSAFVSGYSYQPLLACPFTFEEISQRLPIINQKSRVDKIVEHPVHVTTSRRVHTRVSVRQSRVQVQGLSRSSRDVPNKTEIVSTIL